MTSFVVSPELSVVCFRRDNNKQGPLFAVREFDNKVIRCRDKGRGRGRGPSEQAIRASIRQAILNMNLKSERASKAEIRLLKGSGILGKRAPSCSLLCAEDMIKLLEAFGKHDCVRDLRIALAKDRKNVAPPSEPVLIQTNTPDLRKSRNNSPKSPRLHPRENEERPTNSNSELSLSRSKRLKFEETSEPPPTTRMDALLSALLSLSSTKPFASVNSEQTELDNVIVSW